MIQKRAKITGLLVAVAFMLSAVAAASASAASSWYVEGAALTSGSDALSETITVVEDLTLIDASAGVELECTGLKDTKGELIGPSLGSAESLVFTGCHVLKPGGCKIEGTEIPTVPVTFEAKLGTYPASTLNFEPTKGEILTEPEFVGSCPFVGPQPVKGHCEMEVPKGQEEKASQLVVADCKTLTYPGGSEATLKGKFEIKLTSGKKFSYREA